MIFIRINSITMKNQKKKYNKQNLINLLPINYLFNPMNQFIHGYLLFNDQNNKNNDNKRLNGVEISNPSQMKELWYGGFFGKGIYSRSEPQFIQDNETCWLNYEETVFLNYNLGILKIYPNLSDPNEIEFKSIWNIILNNNCQSIQSKLNWICQFVSYYFFRSKNWIVKSGLKYGTKYVLYHDGPTNKHSEYAVNIIPSSIQTNQGIQSENISLIDLIGSIRVCGTVQKKYMICFVLYPNQFHYDQLLDLDWILNSFKVQPIQISRWLPEKTRS